MGGKRGADDGSAARKTRARRPKAEIVRLYWCNEQTCKRSYGSLSALNTHIRLKHKRTATLTALGATRRLNRMLRAANLPPVTDRPSAPPTGKDKKGEVRVNRSHLKRIIYDAVHPGDNKDT